MTIGDVEIKTDALTADKDANAIATALKGKMTGDKITINGVSFKVTGAGSKLTFEMENAAD